MVQKLLKIILILGASAVILYIGYRPGRLLQVTGIDHPDLSKKIVKTDDNRSLGPREIAVRFGDQSDLLQESFSNKEPELWMQERIALLIGQNFKILHKDINAKRAVCRAQSKDGEMVQIMALPRHGGGSRVLSSRMSQKGDDSAVGERLEDIEKFLPDQSVRMMQAGSQYGDAMAFYQISYYGAEALQKMSESMINAGWKSMVDLEEIAALGENNAAGYLYLSKDKLHCLLQIVESRGQEFLAIHLR